MLLIYLHHSIDPNKTRLIQEMPIPTTKEETTLFLQMAQFNLEFLHPSQLQNTPYTNYAEVTAPLRATKQQARFNWTQECQQSFDTIKQLMASDKILVHYDPSKPTRVYVDFSPCGVSATLAQQHATKWRPVIHVSRSLTPAESNYAQIEGESLAVFYGVTRLRRYLLGTAFEVVGDHKPLLSMYNMGRNGPMRVERHKLQLQGYTFIYIWEPGTTNPADYCSRHPDSQDQSSLDNDDELCVYSIITEGMPQSLSIEAIKVKTDHTAEHSPPPAPAGHHQQAEMPRNSGSPAVQYTKIYDELTTENGVIVRGHRIVIPPSLSNTAIELSHTGHVEPTTTIAHLRERMWFPNLATIAQTYVEACFQCCGAGAAWSRHF